MPSGPSPCLDPSPPHRGKRSSRKRGPTNPSRLRARGVTARRLRTSGFPVASSTCPCSYSGFHCCGAGIDTAVIVAATHGNGRHLRKMRPTGMRIGPRKGRATGRSRARAFAAGEKKPLQSHSEDIPVSQCDGFCLKYPLVILFRGDRHAMFDLFLPDTSMFSKLSCRSSSFLFRCSDSDHRRVESKLLSDSGRPGGAPRVPCQGVKTSVGAGAHPGVPTSLRSSSVAKDLFHCFGRFAWFSPDNAPNPSRCFCAAVTKFLKFPAPEAP